MFKHSSPAPCTNVAVMDAGNARLNWLLRENFLEKQNSELFRTTREAMAVELMSRQMTPQKAYGVLGLALGTFPPMAIFTKILSSMLNGQGNDGAILFFCLFLVMNLVCALSGYGMGLVFGKAIFDLERSSWTKMFLVLPLIALGWGVITGAAGGLAFFGIGALVAPIFAVPVAFVGFLAFAILHRLLENGGMIERKHLLPLAFGISFTISAFILGL